MADEKDPKPEPVKATPPPPPPAKKAADEPALIEDDDERVRFQLSGFLGGFANHNDNAVLTATFKDSSGTPLGTASIGPVTNVDRGFATGLLFRTASGDVPTGTQTIDILLQMTRTTGTDNDGYADNLSLVLNEVEDEDDDDDDDDE